MRIPTDASADVQQAFRELNARLDTLLGSQNIDLGGRRIINAGDAKDPQDYATKHQTSAATGGGADPLEVDTLTVRKAATILNLLRFRQVTLSSPSPGVLRVTRGDGTTLATVLMSTALLAELGVGPLGVPNVHLAAPDADVLQVRTADDSGFAGVKLASLVATVSVEAPHFALDGAAAYTPTNVTLLRTGDFAALSTADVRSIVGTLIKDLQAAGLLA